MLLALHTGDRKEVSPPMAKKAKKKSAKRKKVTKGRKRH